MVPRFPAYSKMGLEMLRVPKTWGKYLYKSLQDQKEKELQM